MLIANLPSGLTDFLEQVVPILQARGIFRLEYQPDTLRGHLGLPFLENRYALYIISRKLKTRQRQSANLYLNMLPFDKICKTSFFIDQLKKGPRLK